MQPLDSDRTGRMLMPRPSALHLRPGLRGRPIPEPLDEPLGVVALNELLDDSPRLLKQEEEGVKS